ncbi:MAG TPA: PAS domain S-box protein [Haliangiales bacterium]|nr:PAS domain S-box protein [Haliangiales bacterium]
MSSDLKSSRPDRLVVHEPASRPSHFGAGPRVTIPRVLAVLCPVVAPAEAAPATPPIGPELTELFWALYLLVALVLVGILWAGIIRRNMRHRTETIRRREAALEEHYRELFENAHDIIFTHDLEGNLTSLNKAGEQILGYSREEAVRLNFTHLMAPGLQDSFREILRLLKDGPSNAHCELEVRAKDSHRVVLRVNLRLQQWSGRPLVQGIAWDITERKHAEAALQESDQRLRRSLEERVQLGRDLHDGIIQSIYAVGLGLQECRNLLAQNPAEAQARLAQSVSDLNLVIRDVRNFIVGLEPEALKGREFNAALQSLVSAMSRTQAAQFSFDIDAPAAEALNGRQAAHLLQIAREAMSNSLRHARAHSTVVSLKKQNGCVRLEVRDDGTGFAPETSGTRGHGLRNIAARADELGARNEIVSTPGKGTRVLVELPARQLYEPG